MIGALISGFFNFILGFVATAIQIIVWPVNQLLTAGLPDIANGITAIGNGFSNLLATLPWALSIIPTSLLWIFTLCWGIRLAVSSLSISTHTLIKVWNVFQKIKFW